MKRVSIIRRNKTFPKAIRNQTVITRKITARITSLKKELEEKETNHGEERRRKFQ